MQRGPMEFMWLGFGIACVGFVALNYIGFVMRQRSLTRISRSKLQRRDWSAIKQRVGSWPVYVAAVCIPVGILMVFSAIVFNNQLRMK
jgi:hypothetical protein